MMDLTIGPSTGWLYAISINSLVDQKKILEDAGANAVELCMGTSLKKKDVRVQSMLKGDRHVFDRSQHRSLHLPDYQPNIKSDIQAETSGQISVAQMADVALIHPLKQFDGYPIDYYENLQYRIARGTRTLLAIENMDKNKPNGFLLPELVDLLLQTELHFVLDVQHAFEHDSSMAYAWDLFQALKSRLVHLHVSGESEGNNHCLVCRARNTSAIVEFLGRLFSEKNVPIILEGEYRTAEDLKAEIVFIKRELGIV